MERGLLSYEAETQTFKTTQKGLRFLTTYYRIGETMKIPSIQQQQIMTKGERWGSDRDRKIKIIIESSDFCLNLEDTFPLALTVFAEVKKEGSP